MTSTPEHPGHWPADDFVPTEELARQQGVRPIKSVDDLPAAEDPFGSDEEYEAFLADLYTSRRAGLALSLVVVDTDVASALLRRRAPDTLARQLAGQTVALTFVTYGVLTKWTLVRHWGPRSLDTMRTFLAGLVVLPYDHRVAVRWGEI